MKEWCRMALNVSAIKLLHISMARLVSIVLPISLLKNAYWSCTAKSLISRSTIRVDGYVGNSVGQRCTIRKVTIKGAVTIGGNSAIRDALIWASAGTEIRIGKFCLIQGGATKIRSKISNVSIGNFCILGYGSMIVSFNHRLDTYTACFLNKRSGSIESDDVYSIGPVEIGHDCMIGDYTLIMPSITLGNGCIVLPNSVVTRSFEPYTIIAGNPAVEIGKRFSSAKIAYLNDINWYEWDDSKIYRNAEKLRKRVSTKMRFE
jgi:acetyltransferase-like isoleucine patch superfamily enzyme